MKQLWIVLLLMSSVYGYSQSVKAELEDLLSRYQDAKDLYIELESTVYEGDKATVVTNIIRKSESQYLYHLPERSMLINDKYIVTVDKRNHNITYDNWTAAKADQMTKSNIPSAKDLFKRYPEVKDKGEQNGLKHYHLHGSKEMLSDVDLYFDIKSKRIKKCVYRYNPKLVQEDIRLETLFKVINTQPNFASSTFSEKQFLAISENKATAAKKYQNYTVYYLGRRK